MPYDPVWNSDWTKRETWFNKLWKSGYYGYDAPDLDWDSYESLSYYENDPIFGDSIRRHKTDLYNEENDRYWSDLEENFGFSRDDLNYPIRSGVYGRGSGSSSGSLELTSEFVNSYSLLGRLMKW